MSSIRYYIVADIMNRLGQKIKSNMFFRFARLFLCCTTKRICMQCMHKYTRVLKTKRPFQRAGRLFNQYVWNCPYTCPNVNNLKPIVFRYFSGSKMSLACKSISNHLSTKIRNVKHKFSSQGLA